MTRVFYPKSRFNVPTSKEAKKLSKTQFIRKITRNSDTTQLEKIITPHLPQMHPIGILGASDISGPKSECFLVSGRPITWILSPKEVTPPRFFHKLYATIANVADNGFSDLVNILGSQEAILSFIRFPVLEGYFVNKQYFLYELKPKGAPGIDQCHPGEGFWGAGFWGVRAPDKETTFPITSFSSKQDVLAGQLRYKRKSISKALPPYSSGDDNAHKRLKRNAVVYRDTLRMMIKLIETEDPDESILMK
ncbi:hypothetical protein AMJ44_10650 [candidate division WOR-1 bacterium DG_54_3]|uniref:Uncharacterized protein n=1 Tax=candidate division WOR-1 bacterium DG_54_3 TaxID=1703775 RepID=A0A0S7XS14_UNCSA|nr:MAG: hypothetical protein AMJ44_10650 [candidate division WOR-1 bacterium DG_54_3]